MSIDPSNQIHEEISNILQQLLDEINRSSKLKNNYSKSDLVSMIVGHDPFSENTLNGFTKKSFSKITRDDVKKFVDSHIFKNPTSYDFYFKFGHASDFPTGYKLGNGIFCAVDRLPKRVKEFLVSHMPYENEKKEYPLMSDEEWVKIRKRDAYMKISVMASGSYKAQEKAFAQMNQNYNIYKIIYGTMDDFSRPPFYFCMHDCATNDMILNEAEQIKWDIVKSQYFDEQVERINKIFNKKDPTELEQRILAAIEVYGLIESNSSIHVKFFLCIAALETLLLGNDKDLLGTKLAQRITFLLADTPWWLKKQFNIPLDKMRATINQKFIDEHLLESRLELHNKIKKFYNKRSKFAHAGKEGKPSESITEADYRWASYFVQLSIYSVINHSKKYTHLTKSGTKDDKCFELYFEKLIYK